MVLNAGAIVGIVLGAVALVLLIAFIVYTYWWIPYRNKKGLTVNSSHELDEFPKDFSQSNNFSMSKDISQPKNFSQSNNFSMSKSNNSDKMTMSSYASPFDSMSYNNNSTDDQPTNNYDDDDYRTTIEENDPDTYFDKLDMIQNR